MAPSTPYSEVSNSSCTSICYKFLLFSLYRNSTCTSPFNSFLTTVCSTPSCTSFKFLPRFNLSLLLPPNLLQFFLRRASNSSCTSIYRYLFPPFTAILFPTSPSFSPSSTSRLFFDRLRCFLRPSLTVETWRRGWKKRMQLHRAQFIAINAQNSQISRASFLFNPRLRS